MPTTVVELIFHETSALTGENVEETFLKCARSILTKIESGTVGCVVSQWDVWSASGVCGQPVGCVISQWGVWSASGVCGQPVGCVISQWDVWSASGMCGQPVGCVVSQWGV